MSKKNKRPNHTVMPSVNKIPRNILYPDNGKSPRHYQHPEKNDSKNPVMKFSRFDKTGPENVMPKNHKGCIGSVFEGLRNFETMSWDDIKNNGSHNVNINQLTKEARDKLQELNMDDIDELFSLRLTGKNRIWGIRDREYLHILWWDPEHKVCPSNKKNT